MIEIRKASRQLLDLKEIIAHFLYTMYLLIILDNSIPSFDHR